LSEIAINQDGLGGTPSVKMNTSSGSERSNLELDIKLEWSIEQAKSLGIDIEEILAGLDSSGEIGTFTKGLVTFEGGALVEINGRISFTLGLGLEYSRTRQTKIVPYIKGNTGLDIEFSIETEIDFECTIGPFGANVSGEVTVDNFGSLLKLSFGLNEKLNYYLSGNSSLARVGFVTTPSIVNLVDRFDVAIAGRVMGSIEMNLRVPEPSKARALIRFGGDISLLLDPLTRNGAFAIFYEVEVDLKIPSFIGAWFWSCAVWFLLRQIHRLHLTILSALF
jgi:hypothetical protein